MDIGVALRTYQTDTSSEFRRTLHSLANQTRIPEVVYWAADETTPDAFDEIRKEFSDSEFRLVKVEVPAKSSRGEALSYAYQESTTELFAILDCGDISAEDRFEIQHRMLEDDFDLAGVGGQLAECKQIPEDIIRIREVPEDPQDVESFAKRRMPVNFPTFTVRQRAIQSVGGFSNLQVAEDFDLLLRLIGNGHYIANSSEILTYVDAEGGLIERRGGFDYARQELQALMTGYRSGVLSVFDLIVNTSMRLPVRLLPNSVRKIVYRHFLRRKT